MAKIDVYGELNSRTGDGKLADASQIWDSKQGKFQDKINQETANDGLVSVKVEQEFTDEEKAQGRANIGAASQEDIDDKIEEIEEDLQDYARKDGSYEQMIVGGAMNLAGQTVEVNSEMYHPTGVNHASGVAEVRNIKGNTVAWNQLVQDGDTEKSGELVQYAALGYLVTEPIVGHKYLEVAMVKTTGTNVRINCFDDTASSLTISDATANTYKVFSKIFTCTSPSSGSTRTAFRIINYKNSTETVYIKCAMLYDLTLIYGTDNEPSTPEEFEADYLKWFGKPLTYEDYDEGSLRSVNMAAYKTVGFNQWDEEWEVGGITAQGIKDDSFTDRWRSKNYTKIIPQTQYYLRKSQDNYTIYVYFYNESKEFIRYQAITSSGGLITIGTDECYLMISPGLGYGVTYNHDICINISNAERNGEYEPYEGHNYPMPVTTMKGKLNGEGASVVVFPDGMRSAGTIHDEIFISGGKTYGIKRVGAVDLGTMTWALQMANTFVAFIDNLRKTSDCKILLTSGKYERKYALYTSWDDGNYIGTRYNMATLYIKDMSYENVTDFTTAMQGVMLVYELETPEIYEIDDFKLPQNILVDSDGTEEVINAQGKENDSVAPYVDMIYSINAVGALNNLPQGYISEKSMDNFLARLSSAMGGTWTKTWNSTLKEWEFSFVQSANTNSLTQNNEEA